jgi:glutamate formiminotransferase
LQAVLNALAAARGACVLHTDGNDDANRTVLTLAGTPENVLKSLRVLFTAAAEKIDMRAHHGAHPRLGAVDVCPLVPVQNITLEQAAQYARELAAFVGEELHIPVYLYEENAASPARKNLAFLRKGEYESLPEKLKTLPPDFGPKEFSPHVAQTGASVIGARNFLIAFNVSLATQDVQIAKEIAAKLREKNGGLPGVKAIGWYMENYHCAQVSFNIVDYHKTGLAGVFEACKQAAAKYHTDVTAGELIGLLPREALLQAGQFYAPDLPADKQLQAAAEKMLLHKIRPFYFKERILEERLADALQR